MKTKRSTGLVGDMVDMFIAYLQLAQNHYVILTSNSEIAQELKHKLGNNHRRYGITSSLSKSDFDTLEVLCGKATYMRNLYEGMEGQYWQILDDFRALPDHQLIHAITKLGRGVYGIIHTPEQSDIINSFLSKSENIACYRGYEVESNSHYTVWREL